MVTSASRIGSRFGRLTIKGRVAGGPRHSVLAVCDCGQEKVVRTCNLIAGRTLSCGCLKRELDKQNLATRRLRHGAACHGKETLEYGTWSSMKARCCNPANRSYRLYGGRGIKICDRWLIFENFLLDVGPRPSPTHTIDRIDNDGDYEPGNCRWSTPKEQASNRSTNVFITVDGVTKTAADWSRSFGLPARKLRARAMYRGFDYVAVIRELQAQSAADVDTRHAHAGEHGRNRLHHRHPVHVVARVHGATLTH